MSGYIFGWCLFAFLAVAILSVVFMHQIRDWIRRRRANYVVKREVPPPDQFDDQFRKYLERHRNGR